MKYETTFRNANDCVITIESDTPMGLLKKFAANRSNRKLTGIQHFVIETDDEGNKTVGGVILGLYDAEFFPEY